MMWIIGSPGGRPRLCAPAQDHAKRLARSGEVIISTPAIGDYAISDDGQTLIALSPAPELVAARIRTERDIRLAQSDWTQLPDVPLSAAQRTAWAHYRQALRDLPAQAAADPDALDWPIRPDA